MCDEMKTLVERVVRQTRVPAHIDEINVETDAALEERYGLEVPVLLVDGKKAAKFRVSEEELTRMLKRRGGAAPRGGTGGTGA